MRLARSLVIPGGVAALCGSLCALARGQEMLDIRPPDAQHSPARDGGLLNRPLAQFPTDGAPSTETLPSQLTPADTANLEGCQVVARIDDQIILACDVLWHVNLLIETQEQKMAPGQKVSEKEIEAVRQQLMKREVQALVDRKLLYNEFRRNVPGENLPRIEATLNEPFEDKEIPLLEKQLHVGNRRDLEHELARLGSSLADEHRAFNEQIIAAQWIHSKITIDEEVSPEEMMSYYQAHLKDYDYPTQARWEELAVRKDRFKDPSEAYAALAEMGNQIWNESQANPIKGPAFAALAKSGKSDGFTASNGGVHDWTTKGALQCTALDNALFTLEVGQLSPILDSGPMYHIVRVLERKEAGRKPFTDVQADIRDKLKEERRKVEMEKYLARLRSEARIWTIFTGNVSAETLLGRKPDGTLKR